MGADLYIESINKKHREKYNPAFQAAVRARDVLTMGTSHGELLYESIVSSPGYKEAQKKVDDTFNELMESDGYFRDSYNNSSLMWVLGLSWWRMRDDGSELEFTEDGNLTPKGAKTLLEEVKKRPVPARPELRAFFERKNEEGPWGIKLDNDEDKEWHKYFVEKHNKFCAFLERAIDLNEDIVFSV